MGTETHVRHEIQPQRLRPLISWRMYEKGSTMILSHIVPERQRGGRTETKTAMTACVLAKSGFSLKGGWGGGRHACEE
jgi:hypothetical protein